MTTIRTGNLDRFHDIRTRDRREHTDDHTSAKTVHTNLTSHPIGLDGQAAERNGRPGLFVHMFMRAQDIRRISPDAVKIKSGRGNGKHERCQKEKIIRMVHRAPTLSYHPDQSGYNVIAFRSCRSLTT